MNEAASMIMTMEPHQTMNLVIAIVVVIAALIIWNFQRDKNNQVDIKDLICVDGKINSNKFMRFTAFVVSTWGFIYLIVDQRFSEWYFAGYMATWTGSALLSKWIDSKSSSTNKDS
jgi:hypothetical protein